jgi:hypothetical protein
MGHHVLETPHFLLTASPGSTLIGAVAILCIAAIRWKRTSADRPLPLPPGPPEAAWFGGHANLLPRSGDKQTNWEVFTEWGKQYGESNLICPPN